MGNTDQIDDRSIIMTEKNNIFNQMIDWWKRLSKKGKLASVLICFLGIIIIVTAVGIMLTDDSNNVGNITQGHYDGKVFSFNYPNDWKINDKASTYDSVMLMPNNSQLIVNGSLLYVTLMAYPPRCPSWGEWLWERFSPREVPPNLDELKNNIINSKNYVYINDTANHTGNITDDPNFKIISDKSINIAGLNGFDLIIQHSVHNLGDPTVLTEYLVLQNGTQYYVLELKGGNNDTFVKLHEDFITIINSLKIK